MRVGKIGYDITRIFPKELIGDPQYHDIWSFGGFLKIALNS